MENTKYRKEAIDSFHKQDELTNSIEVITAKSWFYLLIFFMIIIGFIIWLYFGTITIQVKGSGIIFSQDASFLQVMSPENGGYIKDLKIRAGQKVKKGQVIATIINPQLAKKIHHLKIYLSNEELKMSVLKEQANNAIKKRLKHIDNSLFTTNMKLKTLKEKKSHLESFFGDQKKAFKKGLISRFTLSQTRVDFYNAQNEVNNTLSDIIKLQQQKKDYIESWNQKTRNLEEKIRKTKYELASLKASHELSQLILSPVSGIILSNYVKPGDYLKQQNPISDIVTHQKKLELLAFVDAKQGKKIRVGMKAKVFPDHIKAIKYGGLQGEVYYVSHMPLSTKTIENMIENKSLSNEFLKKGPVIETRIKLTPSKETASGYTWTTSQGPNQKLTIGTLAKTQIIVESTSPISVIIPILKNTKNWLRN